VTTVAVVGSGYTGAVERLRAADHTAAAQSQELARDLAGCGAMIGNPTLTGGLAHAYDRAATGALAAHATLTTTLTGLGTAMAACLYNHTRAEIASYLGATHDLDDPTDPTGLDTGGDRGGWDQLDPASPPTSLGGTDLDLPGWAREVLDLVQGFVWPDADLPKLRTAATAWHRTGQGLSLVAADVLDAAGALDAERSPEIPLAQAALRRVHGQVYDLAADHHRIAAVCTQYADVVAQHRALILGLVQDVKDRAGSLLDAALHPTVEEFLNPFARAKRLTGAALDSAGALLQAATEAAPQLLGYLDQLRAAATDLAATLDSATSSLDDTDRTLFFTDPRTLPGPQVPDSWLRRHEGGKARGHTIRKHVGQTDRQLRRRLRQEPDRKFASTFPDEKTAAAAIKQNLKANKEELESWMKGGRYKSPALRTTLLTQTGRVMRRDGVIFGSTKVLTVVVRDDGMPNGYRILTSFPEK